MKEIVKFCPSPMKIAENTKFFILLKSLVQLGLYTGNFGSLGIDFSLPLSGIVGQMFMVPTIHSCS